MNASETVAALKDSVVRAAVSSWRERGGKARRGTTDPRLVALFDELEARGEEFAAELLAVCEAKA